MANWRRCKYEEVGYYFFNEDFAVKNGFTRASYYCNEECIEKILKSGTYASYGYFKHPRESVPYLDHPLLYKNPKEKKCCLVYLPYMPADDIRLEVEQWAKSKGLKAELYPKSWYSHACLVIISLPDVHVLVDDMYK